MESRLVSRAQQTVSRRGLIAGAGLTAAGAIALGLPVPALAANSEWRLAFRNVHTGENFDALFARNGQYVAQGLAELNHGLRDWRTGEVFGVDRKLLALLVQLRGTLGYQDNHRFDLISGYRSPKTNASLKSAGGAHSGVASQSQHMLGKATDIHMPDTALDRLRSAAMSLHAGGVGYYPKDNFVHVDTGRVRHWGG